MSKRLAHLFGGEAKVKIMRLFVYNPTSIYTPRTVAEWVRVNSAQVRKELLTLQKAGLILKRARGYTLNEEYEFLPAVEQFLSEAVPFSSKEIVKKLSQAGQMRLVLTSGFFKHDPEARVDLLVVGDKLKEKTLIRVIGALEAELGRELRYAVFDTPDFKYRLGVYDRLIRDILDYPHQKLVDKVGL